MDTPSLLEYGGAGALLYLLLKLILDFLKQDRAKKAERTDEGASAPESLDAASLQEIKDALQTLKADIAVTKENTFKELKIAEKLFEMHDTKDEDGVYIWYVKSTLARAIYKLGDAVEKLVRLLKEDHG